MLKLLNFWLVMSDIKLFSFDFNDKNWLPHCGIRFVCTPTHHPTTQRHWLSSIFISFPFHIFCLFFLSFWYIFRDLLNIILDHIFSTTIYQTAYNFIFDSWKIRPKRNVWLLLPDRDSLFLSFKYPTRKILADFGRYRVEITKIR